MPKQCPFDTSAILSCAIAQLISLSISLDANGGCRASDETLSEACYGVAIMLQYALDHGGV